MDWEVAWDVRVPADYAQRKADLLQRGLLARISFWRDSEGLCGVKVHPLEAPLMLEPGNQRTPWHISVSFDDGAAKALEEHLSAPRIVRLKFCFISAGAVAFLAPDCPLGGDPLVRSLHNEGWYADRDLHLSF